MTLKDVLDWLKLLAGMLGGDAAKADAVAECARAHFVRKHALDLEAKPGSGDLLKWLVAAVSCAHRHGADPAGCPHGVGRGGKAYA